MEHQRGHAGAVPSTEPSADTSYPQLADLAEAAARRAARGLRDLVETDAVIAATKSSPTDLVTEADRATEEQIIANLTAARPHDGILAEESGHRDGTSGVTWIIDPIDGTTNFVYALPGFGISIAAMFDGEVVAGVVVDPIRSEVFRATRGGGATCNGRPLARPGGSDLARALIGTGFAYRAERRSAQAAVVTALIAEIRDIRRLGAAALDLCHVAAGRLDGYYESGLKPWDLAAGGLIASEAGCRVEALHGGPPDARLVVAAPDPLFSNLVTALHHIATTGCDVEDPSARIGWEFGRLEV